MTTNMKLPMEHLLDRLWIDLEGMPYQDLRKGKTLRALHHEVTFLLAGPGAELTDALNEVREMQAEQGIPALLVLLDDEDMDGIDRACGWEGIKPKPLAKQVPVRDADMNGVGAIRLNTVGGTMSPCEHGYMSRYTTVARVLRKNDLFMIVDRNDEKLLLVYRALADYDRRKNRVLFERTTPGVSGAGRQYMELPPNLLLYITYDVIKDAQPLSAYEIKEIQAED